MMHSGDAMRRLFPLGSYVLLLFFLTGIWVAISPFAMTTQPSGAHWIPSTINNVVVGAILIAVSLLSILGYMTFELRDILREAREKQEQINDDRHRLLDLFRGARFNLLDGKGVVGDLMEWRDLGYGVIAMPQQFPPTQKDKLPNNLSL